MGICEGNNNKVQKNLENNYNYENRQIEDKYCNIKVIWFDEQINIKENQNYFNKLKSIFIKSENYQSLDKGFENFYKKNNENNFKIILVIVSGRLFGRYIRKINDNINKIINIPYTYIFTSSNFKNVFLKLWPDREHILSYDTMVTVNDGFYNPGGVHDDFNILLNEMKKLNEKIISGIKIKQRIKDKLNYEGILTFEYLDSEEDLLAPALYKDIITNEEITIEDCKNFNNFLLSFNEGDLNSLIKNLDLFTYIPFEILSKYWARCYTIESDFYKILNNHLMKSKLSFNYKTFIKMLYVGVEINSLNSYQGNYLYRGSSINKTEIDKIIKFKNEGKLSNIVVFSRAFLSFSEDKYKAESFCGQSDSIKISCLYILENKNINLHESNADIQNISVFTDEKEILFFPGSSFIITNIELINDRIVIKLNYNGKFKEKYSLIYNNKQKINQMIYNNELTKNISGKELCFLKNGKYLKGEFINNDDWKDCFKGKDLETDEIVLIGKGQKSRIYTEYLIKEYNNFKDISEINNLCKLKDYFETEQYIYSIYSYYDVTLDDILEKRKKLPPNLIKKILKQLNVAFKTLLNNNIAHRDIKPENILIKYSNKEKTNFDSVLSGFSFGEKYNDEDSIKTVAGTPLFMAPEILKGFKKNIVHKSIKYKNNCDLFSIGETIYLLYFGNDLFNANCFEELVDEVEIYDSNSLPTIYEDKALEDLLKKLLKVNPNERITWEEYFDHPFFKQYEY